MACFIVPAAEAVAVTAIRAWRKKEEENSGFPGGKEEISLDKTVKIPMSAKLKKLSHLLWGGSALLAFEHIWNGEIVAWFPFLSRASNPVDLQAMLQEMAVTGVSMAALVTVVWGIMSFVSDRMVMRENVPAVQRVKKRR